MWRRYGASVALLGALVLSPTAGAKRSPEDERRILGGHLERAKRAFNLARYATAIREWQFAYNSTGEPALLFNIAQAYRLSNRYAEARQQYETYLHELPNAPNRAEVKRFITLMAAKASASTP